MPKLINKSEKKIITEIMKNPGLNLREIISRTKLSPNVVTEYVNYFVKKEVIIEDRLIKNKRTYLRRFSVNYKSNLAKNLISLIKESEKEEFFLKYKSLEQAFNQIVENVKKIDFILVYGSYARFAADKESDIDILIVGDITNKDEIRETLVSLEIEPSIKIERLSDFKKRIGDDLHKQIIKEHILLFDSGNFIKSIQK
ncbi:winged helix-turn-helix transcriptional regulator [Candidatus Pacearchaeota archaeon]|nr:winged helix-turn-helix transcriptional regulator [Candidatus Pacearchaeota archaeon]